MEQQKKMKSTFCEADKRGMCICPVVSKKGRVNNMNKPIIRTWEGQMKQ